MWNCTTSFFFKKHFLNLYMTFGLVLLYSRPLKTKCSWCVFGNGKPKAKKPLCAPHNAIRQTVRWTKWVSVSGVGFWVGAGWGQWYFSILQWSREKTRGVRDSEVKCWKGRGEGGSWPISLPEMKTSATGTDYVPIMCNIWSEEDQDKSQCGYLNIRPPACLDKQDLHVGFSAWALGRCVKAGVDEGWLLGGNSALGALGVATMGTDSLSSLTHLTQSDFCLRRLVYKQVRCLSYEIDM